MTTSTRRSVLRTTAWSSLAIAAALAGCTKKEDAAPAAASEPAAASAAAAPASGASAPLKIAFAYLGPVGDGGWTFAHDNGRKALEKELGSQVQTSFVESVPESADAERVFRDMVAQGDRKSVV